ncbi:hypothetical protein PHLGIDRAFT_126996, partial [Phlebiopsis gigantea 11061_1 CR5-6]
VAAECPVAVARGRAQRPAVVATHRRAARHHERAGGRPVQHALQRDVRPPRARARRRARGRPCRAQADAARAAAEVEPDAVPVRELRGAAPADRRVPPGDGRADAVHPHADQRAVRRHLRSVRRKTAREHPTHQDADAGRRPLPVPNPALGYRPAA